MYDALMTPPGKLYCKHYLQVLLNLHTLELKTCTPITESLRYNVNTNYNKQIRLIKSSLCNII